MDALTDGVDHVGLTVADAERSATFFTDCLGWRVIGGKPEYPAVFVSDGHTRVTLWRVSDPSAFTPFERRNNIGLHHLALKVATLEKLHALYARIAAWEGAHVEFGPEPSAGGPRIHCMIREPGGCRLEFVWTPDL